jgi:hypothetical protein
MPKLHYSNPASSRQLDRLGFQCPAALSVAAFNGGSMSHVESIAETAIFRARLPRALVEQVEGIAARAGVPRDLVVRQALDAWLQAEEQKGSEEAAR